MVLERGRKGKGKRTSSSLRSIKPRVRMAAAAAAAAIVELDPSDERAGRVIDNIVRLERRIFPKHESLARSIHDELKRRNSGLIYMASTVAGGDGDEVVGYAMYTCPTSLCASITKLAGESLLPRLFPESCQLTPCAKLQTLRAVKESHPKFFYT